MRFTKHLRGVALVGIASIALNAPSIAASGGYRAAVHRMAPAGAMRPSSEVTLSVGAGRMITLPAPISDLFIASENVADVQVRSAREVYLIGKGAGETSFYAANKAGDIVYSATVRVGKNIGSVDQMLAMAMPDAKIVATPMNGLVLLTGTVASPEDAAEAERLVTAYVGEGVSVVSRLRAATPLQVQLRVQIAEVSRTLAKEIGNNITTQDAGARLPAGVFGYGRPAATFNPAGGGTVTVKSPGATFGLITRLFGLNVADALDLAETDGMATMLAQPNLTAVSGETASFLAGGEIPIPLSTGLGQVSVEYKQYGVSLSFTPTVLADGRISMRVRPEVSELSADGAVTLNGFTIPGIVTRRSETTVELGSGQSMVIGGLLKNNVSNTLDKVPGVGDVPILGALFRSTAYRRSQSELMIVVTPFLVKPVSASQIVLPTDGLKAPTDLERVLLGQTFKGSNEPRPVPTMAPPTTVTAPAARRRVGAAGSAPMPGFSQ